MSRYAYGPWAGGPDPLAGPLDDWVGGFTIASDRRSIIYSRRSYESREVVLVDQFR